MTLTIQAEPIYGLVYSLKRGRQLLTDWIIFHVKDISAAVQKLEGRGVAFPTGIDSSEDGQTAYFQDPDGHSLALWQPPPEEGTDLKINFFPALHRILSEQV